MANEVTTTSANDLVYSAWILASDILEAFYGQQTAMHLVRFSSIADLPTKAKDFPTSPVLSAASVAEGVDMSNTAFSTGKATVTAAEVGLLLTVTDVLSMSDIVDDSYYAQQAGEALADKVTTDICSLSSGFSSSVGATGVNLTEANILDGIQTLMAAGVPGPYHGILHPIQYRDLATAVGGTLSPAATTGTESVRQVTNEFGARPNGGLGELYGVMWSISSNVPTANAGADRAGMIVNPRNAIGFVEKGAARVEPERDASLRAREIAVTAMYGVGELKDAAGVGVITDA